MPKILTYNSPSGAEKKIGKDNPFKTLWEKFQSFDKFTKFYILAFLLIVVATPFVVNNLLETRQRAQTPPSPTTTSPHGPEYVTDQYIVVLKEEDDKGNKIDPEVEAEDAVKTHGVQKKHVYKYALNGFSFHGSAQAAEALKQNPKVKFVVQDSMVHTADCDSTVTFGCEGIPTGIHRIGAQIANGTTFVPAPAFPVAVIDTGIELTHPSLNASEGINCVTPGASANDDNGHGTSVAGVVGANGNSTLQSGVGIKGVIPNIKVIAVKVLDRYGSGPWSQVICGIDWVTANASTIKVANMSLAGLGNDDGNCGNTNNDPGHQAICRSVAAGVTYVVAAANSDSHIGGYTPAAYNEVITATALADYDGKPGGLGTPSNTSYCPNYGPDDTFAGFSNWPSASEDDLPHTVGAPGVCVATTAPEAMGGTEAFAGTSAASPHVAGAAAVYISLHPGIKPSQVMAALRGSGETLGNGHTDPSGLHPEPVINLPALYNYPVPSGGGTTPTPSIFPTGIGGVSNINVSLTQPTNSAVIPVGKTIVLKATATDTVGVNITKVEFYVNGARKCSDTSSPYTCNFKVPTTVGAIYTITAKAYDITGNTKVSLPSNVTGGIDTVYPSVNLTSPLNGAVVNVGSVVSITATASDTVGVSKVEFYVNGSRKCSDNSYPYSCNWTVPTGSGITYTLNAKAYDFANNTSNSTIAVTSQ